MKLKILSLDPGKQNFAFSIVTVDIKTGLKFEIIETGMINHTITNVTTDLKDQAKAFNKEVSAIIRKNKVDALIAERFMVRGRFMGGSSEHINLMLGRLLAINVETVYITAAQWKNAFNKVYCLNDFYKEIPLPTHRIDAALIGLYGSHYFTNTKPFACLKGKVKKVKNQIILTK
jgi:hypothetical protein